MHFIYLRPFMHIFYRKNLSVSLMQLNEGRVKTRRKKIKAKTMYAFLVNVHFACMCEFKRTFWANMFRLVLLISKMQFPFGRVDMVIFGLHSPDSNSFSKQNKYSCRWRDNREPNIKWNSSNTPNNLTLFNYHFCISYSIKCLLPNIKVNCNE